MNDMCLTHPRKRVTRFGFTLIELLVVIAIISILAAILFPVFATAREKARSAACASNEKQIALGMLQYVQDYDENYPDGLPYTAGTNRYRGAGWYSQVYAYLQSGARNNGNPTNASGIEKCPDEATTANGAHAPINYAYNGALVYAINGYTGVPEVSKLTAADHTVLLCEVTVAWYGVYCNNWDTAYNGDYSPGVDGYGGGNIEPGESPVYQTGYMKDLGTSDTSAYINATGRHTDGSNWAFCDGHVKWLQGTSISAGLAAATPTTTASGDSGKYNAAGTAVPGYVGTFSPV